MSIAMNLKNCRKAKGLTQAEVAEKLGVTQSAYAHYENGIRKVEADRVPDIAKILGVGVQEIYGETANGKAAKPPRLHKNKRAVKVQELYEKLSNDEQRVVMKQIKLMAGQGR